MGSFVSLFEVDECILIDDEENYMCIIDIKKHGLIAMTQNKKTLESRSSLDRDLWRSRHPLCQARSSSWTHTIDVALQIFQIVTGT
jgi:hypothetical protein